MPVTFSGGASLPTPGSAGYAAAQSGSGNVNGPGANAYSSNTGRAGGSGGSAGPGANIYNSSTGQYGYQVPGASLLPGWSWSGNNGSSPPPSVPSTIDGGNLGGSQFQLPNSPGNSSSNAFVNSLTPAPQGDPNNPDNSGGGTDVQNQRKNAIMSDVLSTIGAIGEEGDKFNQLNEQYQVPEITQQLASLRGTIAQRTAAYTQQWQMANEEHAALPYIAGEQTQIQRSQAIEIGVLSAQEQALAGNLQAASDIVDRTITHEFEPLKTQLQALQSFYTMNQNDLSESESLTLQHNYALQSADYNNFLSTKSDAYKTAIQYGAPTSTLTALANAKSSQDVWNALSGITSGSNDINGTNTSSGIVNGYDLSTYATDPQYGEKIMATSTSMGQISSVGQADKIIDSSAPSSPITGAMIASAAGQYNVDPNMLMSVLKVESNFGTLGTGAKTNNPGNVGNTDSGATQKFPTWQDGVNATAQQLANRKVSVQDAFTNAPAKQTQQAVTNSAPLLVRPALRFTQTGTSYIDGSKLDSTNQTMASVFSSKTGIPILNNEEVSAVQGLDTALSNLNSMDKNFQTLAPGSDLPGALGTVGNLVSKANFKLTAPFSKLFDTDYGAALSAYQANRDSLFQQVSALAGSHPRLNGQELTTAANALPRLNELNTDTLKDGANKVAIVKQLLENSLKTYLPTYKGTSQGLSGPVAGQIIPGANSTQWRVNNDGSYTRIK